MRLVIAGGNGTAGRHAVRTARERGHDVTVLSRRDGHDVTSGAGLTEAMAGADAVIDVSSVQTASGAASVAFFTAATTRLLAAERAAGVGHHVALSIVGIDGVDAGYYAGKLAQESAVAGGDVPYTLLRATQFHEFAVQVLGFARLGGLSLVPTARIRPVAAREVGARLVELAETGPAGRVRDLTGPRDERLADMVRRLLAAQGVRRRVLELRPPGRYWRATASGVLRGAADADRGAITFDDWLASADRPAA